MTISVHIAVPTSFYLRNPEETELGRSIVSRSIDLMLELGFEKFTFKKLAAQIRSTEASVYRYFSSKHHLLQYLSVWYWLWATHLLRTRLINISDPKKRLRLAVGVLIDATQMDYSIPHIDESKLLRIVAVEGAKADVTTADGASPLATINAGYGIFCAEFAKLIRDYKKSYASPRALVTTLVESSHRLLYLCANAPSTVEVKVSGGDNSEVLKFLENILFGVLDR